MLKVNQIKCPVEAGEEELNKRVLRKLKCKNEDILSIEIARRSIDARKKPEIFFIYTVYVTLKNEEKIWRKIAGDKDISREVPKEWKLPNSVKKVRKRPVIVGFGPSGIFCALELARCGLSPLVLERGKPVEERVEDVEAFWKSGILNRESNVQFGEGGAGTFSDGKLNTLVKDRDGRAGRVLSSFVQFGASEEVKYDARPHIGTDRLRNIIRNIREEIIRLGGEIRFSTCVSDLLIENDVIKGVVTQEGETILTDNVVLAVGHSARDTFRMLSNKQLNLEAKSFAVGFRVIHPQEYIQRMQYGGNSCTKLQTAAYKVTASHEDRGIYSFCMCPGGYVLDASSEPERLCVNGMSYSGQSGKCANSAIIISVSPKDYPGEDVLAGIRFQEELEKRTYMLCAGKIPIQRYGDYKKSLQKQKILSEILGKQTLKEFEPAIKGRYEEADLTKIFSENLAASFAYGMEEIGRKMHGFADDAVWLCGTESRTSSPLRIPRDENMEASVKGLFPIGEGAGYAGGILSAAMDGVKCAMVIAEKEGEL